ncbi:MAG TPA: hypothetical protein VK586_11575 [Streptosporangiaceae bacterium]|nr:hypothetical protein [Streptosporangiaceae bacterium]
MSAVQPGGHAEHAAGMVAGNGGHDWVQQAQVHATLATADAIRDLITEVANLAEGLAEAREALAAEVANLADLADCTPARRASRSSSSRRRDPGERVCLTVRIDRPGGAS